MDKDKRLQSEGNDSPGERVVWTADGSPQSPRFQDCYRSRSGGLAQAVSVYLAGVGLPERWRGRDQFCVLETGFGLGLNFLTTWAAWEADPQRSRHLHFTSVEAYPVAGADIIRSALSAGTGDQTGSSLASCVPVLAGQLARVWHGMSPGIHQFDFADDRVRLTLAVGDVQYMLRNLQFMADAVYLDGFSPALNPQMWSARTLEAVASHCQPDAVLASYTVAKSVRDGLQALGFSVQKCPGLAPKRHRLTAFFGS